jgi:hypothetical protein
MKKRKNFDWIYHFSILCLIVICTSCYEPTPPENKIISLYKSTKIANYQLQKVAVLQMIYDDTTDIGTFYSTNHLINKLSQQFSEIKFEIPDIKNIVDADSLIVPKIIDSIEKDRSLNLSSFYDTDLGGFLSTEHYDAMFIGTVDSCYDYTNYQKLDWAFNSVYLEHIYIRSCYFRYYLISLIDGKVLWKASILGSAANYFDSDIFYSRSSKDKNYAPPLDCAISNGIDIMTTTIPFIISQIK